MRKVAPEVDQLMWVLAEQGDTRAVEEFEARYPDQRYELARRIAMLRGLRGEGRKAHRVQELPRFQPIEAMRPAIPKRTLYGVGLLSLAAIAAATYTVATFFEPSPPPKTRTVMVRPEPPAPTPAAPTVVYTNPPPVPNSEPVETPTQAAAPKYLQPQDLEIEGAPLQDALRLIAAKGGIVVTMAEGVPNPEVRVSYRGRNTLEMLQDLGRTYGFTPFDEGDGTILVIPATDPTKPSTKPDPQSAGDLLKTKALEPMEKTFGEP